MIQSWLILPALGISALLCTACIKTTPINIARQHRVGDTLFVMSPADGVEGPATLVEELRIPSTQMELGQLDAAAFGPHGTIWIYDSRAAGGETLYVLDSMGKPVGNAGHHGTGPGEYQGPARVFGLANRSVLLKEMSTTRANRYGPGGELIATIVLPVAAQNGWLVTPDLSGGWFIASSFETNTPKRVGKYGWLHFDTNAVVRDTVFPPRRFFEEPSPGGIAPGRIRTVARDRTVLTAIPGASRIDRIMPDGRVMAMEWRAEAPRYLDDERADMQKVEDKLTDLMGLPRTPLPDRKAPVDRIYTDLGERVWAQLATIGERIPDDELPKEPAAGGLPPIKWHESRDKWALFDDHGVMRFTVTMPPRASVRDRSGDRLLGQVLDENNVPSLVVWRVVPQVPAGHL